MKCSLLVLSCYLDGELEARREGELEAHLVGCQRCRAGLGYLREEVERVSALGRVHVAEHSVHDLLTQLGLIAEDEALPDYHASVALAEPPPAPAWLGGDDATTLPWDVTSAAVRMQPARFEPDVTMTGSPDPAAYQPEAAGLDAGAGFTPTDETVADPQDAIAAEEEELVAAEADVAPPEEPDAESYDAIPEPDDALPEPPAAPIPIAPPEPAAPERPWFRWVPEPPAEPAEAPAEQPAASHAPLPFTWSPPAAAQPSPQAAEPAAPEPDEHGVPAVPFGDAGDRPGSSPRLHGPPPASDLTDTAPSAPSGGAFPPGGPERTEASEPLIHDFAPGGEPEMTASPPWTPREAPTGPIYPMTDDDVLGAPMPVERFAPPAHAPKPSLFDRLRDRIAVRRALSRSSSAYDDQVQIVSGLGAPLRTGRARLEVERRRQEALRPDHDVTQSSSRPLYDAARADAAATDFDAEIEDDGLADLGPLPPLPQQFGRMPRPDATPTPPRPPAAAPRVPPGQMALPGTSVDNPLRTDVSDWRAPIHRTPMPPPRHTIGSVLGEVPPPQRPPLPPGASTPPPAMPPAPPVPDPLGEVLSDFDRDRSGAGGSGYAPRPWRPREIAEDLMPAKAAPAPPDAADRRAPSPSQLRDGRRLLAIFGAATLLMLVVGIASGRTVSPLPTSNTTSSNTPTQQPKAKASQPAARTSQAPASSAPAIHLQPSQAPAAGGPPSLSGTHVVGDSGSGYQVKDFRYGIHPNDFRIVLDYAPAGTATGTPKATVGFLDQTTIDVVLEGVVPAGSTGDLPSTNPVTAVTLQQPSPFPGSTTYQIKLAHPATFSVGYVNTGGVLKLVIDIAG